MILRPGIVGIYVKCKRCGLQKKPLGRDTAFLMCEEDCTGYMDAPKPGNSGLEKARGSSVTQSATTGSQRGDDDDLETDRVSTERR